MKLKELKSYLISRTEPVDARIIIREAAGFDDIAQILHAEDEISPEAAAKAERMLAERISGRPMAYILGEKEFYGLPFTVNESVLIPRPDTETLVDTAIELAASFRRPRILDLCTGSGAVGTAIAATLSIPVSLSDISPEALDIAKQNYRRNTGHEPDARLGSLYGPWEGERFDIIASNPPYLTPEWYEDTDADVKAEPEIAFLGGPDGLDLIRIIISAGYDYLNENGYIALECDYRQIDNCVRILQSSSFSGIGIRKDLAGKERVVYGRKRERGIQRDS